MGRLRFSLAPRRLFRTDFAAEWAGVVIVSLLAALWALSIGFSLTAHWHDLLLFALSLAALLVVRALMVEKLNLIVEYFLLTLLATTAFGVLSYLSMTTERPLVDDVLMAADRAIGFDWLAGYRILAAHHTLEVILQFAYNSLIYQGLYFGVLFGLMGKRQNLREMFWLVFAAGLLTSAGAALFPAFGPFKTFHMSAEFLPTMEQLHGGARHFELAKLTGVVSFPSFHTTMALLYIYAYSRAGVIGWAVAALNLLMLFAIPFFGGHYLVDMIAGGAVALASLAIVRAWPRMAAGTAPVADGIVLN
ncbi:MAG TPA: phosphatase PAP2 family protein [Rhizomicrobium sp.]|nr:phosphatase PAP2 family protein [Rhizomicrobium sp.]